MPPDSIDKRALFDRLAASSMRAGGITVLTPNRRLAQSLAGEFDEFRRAAGEASWPTADILPYGAFVARLHEDALYSDSAGDIPLLLAPEQELLIWEEIVRHSEQGGGLLALPQTAVLAREAWALAQEWRIADKLFSAARDDDAVAFAGWAKSYEVRTRRENLTERARLPDLAQEWLGSSGVATPELIVTAGFDIVAPQQRAFFDALLRQGVALAELAAPIAAAIQPPMRLPCLDTRDEIRRAAQWARARLQANAAARIGIVVPELERHRHALRRVLGEVLASGAVSGAAASLPFNLSLGEKLSAYPLVAHAIALLELCGREVPLEQASLLITSPFIATAESERELRARFDAALRRGAEPTITLDRLAELAQREDLPRAAHLGECLAALARFRRERLFATQSPRAWAEAFGEALACVGFPGERTLDSIEHQALARWQELLAQFARLERVARKSGFNEALARVARLAAATDFQPQAAFAPIQVLGVLEAAGLVFDHLWVMGLSEEAWPLNPPANPFLPFALQRGAGVPNASPAATLALTKRLTAGWLAAAGEVVLSHAVREGDRILKPSPLIASITEGAIDVDACVTWRERIHASAALEQVEEAPVPLVPGAALRGAGSGLLRDQAACAFSAFARHRLGAQPLESAHAGLDALERGTLVHRVLALAWRELKTKQNLDSTPTPVLRAQLERIASEELARRKPDRPRVLAGRYAAIEAQRLARLALAWLEHERGRGDFSVVAIEEKRALQLGGLTINVRLDRVDETPEGRVVIDYKTGEPKLGAMLRARPDEPQLPLYAAFAEPESVGAAFAQLGAGRARFVGLTSEEGLLPAVRTPAKSSRSGAEADWPAQRVFWRAELTRLAEDFAAGRAEVDPKKWPETCRYCGLQALCRVREQRAALVAGDGEAANAD